jgi:uncharacterized protein (TIGR03435 family)
MRFFIWRKRILCETVADVRSLCKGAPEALTMRGRFMSYSTRLVRAGILAGFAAAILIGFVGATPSGAQSSVQNAVASAPVFEYEVATIKAYKPGASEGPGMMRVGIMNTQDGFTASGATLQMLIAMAYGIQNFQIAGAPDWFDSDRFEINAKMENSVADALAKLSQDDRTLARQKMLQALLADRFKLTVHHESKELPAYTLTIGKNGSKLVEAPTVDPASTATAGTAGAGRGGASGPGPGGPGRGGMQVSAGAGGLTLNSGAVPMVALVRVLSQFLRAPVIDSTGLKGYYEIKLTFTPDNFGGGGAPGFAAPPPGGTPNGAAPPDPSAEPVGPTLLIAVQEQLGLKLERSKGPVEIVVIDHAEKASDN